MKRTGPIFQAPMSIGRIILAVAFTCMCGLLGNTSLVHARPLVRMGTPPIQFGGTLAGHIYVAGSQFASQTFVGGKAGVQRLMRYPLKNGKPAATPDLSYPTKTDGPMAIDTAGNVYSAADCMTVNVFAPNKNTVLRSLHIQLSCGDHVYHWTVIRALKVDANGYLFVSIHEDCVSCSQPAFAPQLPPTGNPLSDCKRAFYSCTLVYAPGASGTAAPLFSINPGYYSNGAAVSAAGRLFLEAATSDTNATGIQKWINPDSGPTLGETLSGPDFVGPTGFAIDFSQTLYVNNTKLSGSSRVSSYIATYSAYWFGTQNPLRVFQTSPAQLFWFGTAVDSGWLYTGTGQKNLLGTTPTLETFHKGGHGNVVPAYTQAISFPEDPEYVAVGP